jgi:hypothetical protein
MANDDQGRNEEKVKAMYRRQETSKTNHKKMSFTTQS